MVYIAFAWMVVVLVLGGVCTEFVIETWVPYFTGNPIDVAFWKCMILSPFVAQFTIPVALITWLFI